MAFWSSEKLKQRGIAANLVAPFDAQSIKHGGYELSLGHEAFITSDEKEKKQPLQEGEQLVIPPGQFGLLLTEEEVHVPKDAIGFISIKASIKFRGLVNVSGFHVDPGFSGKLKFSVYNAGSQNIVLTRRQRVFLIWFSDLDQLTSDHYSGDHANQKEISSEDVMRIQGKVHSPAVLDKRLTDLEHTIAWIKGIALAIATGIILLMLKLILETPLFTPSSQVHSTEGRSVIEEPKPQPSKITIPEKSNELSSERESKQRTRKDDRANLPKQQSKPGGN